VVRRRGVGVDVDDAVPALVAQRGQHLVLLRQRELLEGRARRRGRDAAPVEAGGLEVLARAFGEVVHDAPGRVGGRQLDVDLLVGLHVAQAGQHHVALRGRELLEAGAVCRPAGATPVDGGGIEVGAAGREAVYQLQPRGGAGLVVRRALLHLVAQRMRHDGLLRRGQVGEAGWRPARRRCPSRCWRCCSRSARLR
jgi:hypothetical protein